MCGNQTEAQSDYVAFDLMFESGKNRVLVFMKGGVQICIGYMRRTIFTALLTYALPGRAISSYTLSSSGRLAQLARAFPLHGKGHWFESSSAHYDEPRFGGVFHAQNGQSLVCNTVPIHR